MARSQVVFGISSSVFMQFLSAKCLGIEHRESKPGSVLAVCGGGIHAALHRFNTSLTGQDTSFVHKFHMVPLVSSGFFL
jgi:hypothetical protein